MSEGLQGELKVQFYFMLNLYFCRLLFWDKLPQFTFLFNYRNFLNVGDIVTE